LAARLEAERAGLVHGIAGWFVADLSPGVQMTNSPSARAPIRRRQVVFPLREPLPVRPGERLDVRMRILTNETVVAWGVERAVDTNGTQRPRPVALAQSTLRGMLLSEEDLRRTDPDSTPRLSEWAHARLLILRLCDGRTTLRTIEDEVHLQYPTLFPQRAAAAEFVAEVVTRYAL
jgi:hypothetical protein